MAASPGDGPLLYAAESLLTDAGLRPLRRSSAGRAQPGFPAALCQNLFGGHTVMLNPSAVALLRRAGAPAGDRLSRLVDLSTDRRGRRTAGA